jgi:hypothetical protein
LNRRIVLLSAIFIVSLLGSSSVWSHAALQGFTVTSSGPANSVFINTGTQAPRSIGAGATWPVTVDLGLLGSQPSTVVLNFPDRSAATLTRMRSELRGPPGFLWTGRGDGCTVVFSAWSSGFRGVIACINANYGIDLITNGSGLQLTRYDAVPGATETAWEPPPASSTAPASPGSTPSAPTQVDTVIDILVLYTEAVRLHFDPSGGNANTIAFMRQCVDTTQAAMDASTTSGQPTIAQVNMVAAKKVSRNENGDDFAADLDWLRTQPEPMGLRNFWAADVVVYVTEDSGTTYGLSNQPKANGLPAPGPSFAPYALSVSMRNRALNDDSGNPVPQPYVFMHEIAHTLGADHDYGHSVNPSNPVEPWSYGHWATRIEGGNRTIMSYLVSPDCAAPCSRILNYSNSQVVVDWFRTGVANTQENARTINDYGPTAAQYRASLGRIFYDGFEP